MNRLARFVLVVPLLSMFMAMSLSALAEEPKRPPREPRASAMRGDHRRFDPRHFDHRLWALGRRIPTDVGGDAAAIGGGPMAIGISTTTLCMVRRRLFPRSRTMNKAV
jgi:hypothetical protein